jgi:hypothetical protein
MLPAPTIVTRVTAQPPQGVVERTNCLAGIDIHKPYRPVTMAQERGAGPAADLAARSAHDEITERTQVLVPADDDEAVADPHDLWRLGSSDRLIAADNRNDGHPGCTTYLQLGDGLVSARRVRLEGHPIDEQVVEHRLDSSTTAGLKNAPPRIAPSFRARWSLSSTAEAWSESALRPWTTRRPLWWTMTVMRPPLIPVIW